MIAVLVFALLQGVLGLAAMVMVLRVWTARAAAARRRTGALPTGPCRVAFLHPDLGIGGAERLVIDAAVGLQGLPPSATAAAPAAAGTTAPTAGPRYTVQMFTNYHDPQRAFDETVDGTLPPVVLGGWLPRHVAHRGHVLLATLRMAAAAAALVWRYQRRPATAFDLVVVDQVAGAMPVLKLLAPLLSIVFYCHFPDQLCDPSRAPSGVAAAAPRGMAHRLYRAFFDAFEGWTMAAADHVLFNSRFTKGVSTATFPAMAVAVDDRDVLYPPVDLAKVLAEPAPAATTDPTAAPVDGHSGVSEAQLRALLRTHRVVVSLNRFERKKNIGLAIDAVAAVCADMDVKAGSARPVALVVAGGYDPRLAENVDHHNELVRQATAHACLKVIDTATIDAVVAGQPDPIAPCPVLFLRSCTARAKYYLLAGAAAVCYTPTNEHFGIVPIEAMAHGRCVVAVNAGGPVESVGLDDRCGFLRPPEPATFAAALCHALDPTTAEAVGAAAALRVAHQFGLDAFTMRLAAVVDASIRQE